MIRQLKIRNLVLVEASEISFEKGLNVLTGESGAGKSAILHALGMIQGNKVDTSILRKGAEKGSVEAFFSVPPRSPILNILDAAGVDPFHEESDRDPELLLKREICSNGRSRAFINNQIVQASLLETVAEMLFEIVGQHANQTLRTPEQHRQLLDIYGEVEPLYQLYKESWSKKNQLTQELHSLLSKEGERLRAIEICTIEIEEIEDAKLQEEEDTTLFQEYSLLCRAEERGSKLDDILTALQGERNPILSQLRKCAQLSKDLCSIDPELSEIETTFSSCFIELEEALYTLRNYRARIDFNPEKMTKIDQRLSILNKLKRKYGASIAEIHAYMDTQIKKAAELKNADQRIEEVKALLKAEEQKLKERAKALSEGRQLATKNLEVSLTEQLQQLNMPKAQFKVELTSQDPGPHGQEKIEFYMAPNAGEKCMPIRECASGGELSRVLLALKVLLSGKASIPTLIFDEIDSNIGGATAVVIGQKLKEIGVSHQVFCITHFAQVARLGEHHLQIRKEEKEGRTFTLIERLTITGREKEFERMLGNVVG